MNLVKLTNSDDDLGSMCRGKQTLVHVLSAYKMTLTQGRFTWHHNLFLKELSAIVDETRLPANKCAKQRVDSMRFLKDGKVA